MPLSFSKHLGCKQAAEYPLPIYLSLHLHKNYARGSRGTSVAAEYYCLFMCRDQTKNDMGEKKQSLLQDFLTAINRFYKKGSNGNW